MKDKSKITVRMAKFGELKRISYITRLAWKIPYNNLGIINKFNERRDLAERFLDGRIKILAAVCEGKIIGAVRYEFPEEDEIYFSKLAVLSSFRKQGVGSALINRLETIASKSGINKISLDVMEEKFLVSYYQKFGYKIVKRRKHINHHEVYMSKRLRSAAENKSIVEN